MSYSIQGLIIPQAGEATCRQLGIPVVPLDSGMALIPMDREPLLLAEGGETEPEAEVEIPVPEWLEKAALPFSESAWIEAEFWGGEGMQAALLLREGRGTGPAEISCCAINNALRMMGVADGPGVAWMGFSLTPGKDPFELVGLGRHRSIEEWMEEAAAR